MDNVLVRSISGSVVGILFAIVIGFVIFAVGIILTLTIIGAILGIPMILMGLFAMIASPIIGVVGGLRGMKRISVTPMR